MGPGLEKRIPTAAIANTGLSAINPTRARLVSKTRLTLDGRNLVAVEVIEAIFVGHLTLLGASEAGRPATLKVHSPAGWQLGVGHKGRECAEAVSEMEGQEHEREQQCPERLLADADMHRRKPPRAQVQPQHDDIRHGEEAAIRLRRKQPGDGEPERKDEPYQEKERHQVVNAQRKQVPRSS